MWPVCSPIALCLSAIYLGLDGWSDNNPPQYLLDDTVLDLLRYQNIVTLLLAFIVLSRGYYNVVTQAQAALAKEASTDPLTGAVNRRRLMDMGRSEMAKQQPGSRPWPCCCVTSTISSASTTPMATARGTWCCRIFTAARWG